MTPDLIYFAHLAPSGHFGHTLPGLFLFCLPAGLALLWTFDRLLKQPLVELAPAAAQRRLAPVVAASPFERPLLAVGAAVLIGAATHAGWDAFTHTGGWGVEAAPALRSTVALGPLGSVPLYKLAQHGSTLLGLSALLVAAALWWRGAPEAEVRPRLSARTRAVRLSLFVSVALLVGAGYGGVIAAAATSPLPTFLGRFVIATTSAGFVVAVGYSLWRRAQTAPAG